MMLILVIYIDGNNSLKSIVNVHLFTRRVTRVATIVLLGVVGVTRHCLGGVVRVTDILT